MEYDEDNYFELLYCPYFAPSLSYEKKKMEYLRNSNGTSYTEEFIGNDTPSNALWGVRCFRRLIPYIEQYFPVDISVSDKEIYCCKLLLQYQCQRIIITPRRHGEGISSFVQSAAFLRMYFYFSSVKKS